MNKCKSPIFRWPNHANRTRKTPDTMDMQTEQNSGYTIDGDALEVLALLQRPGKGDPAFTADQLRALKANGRIRVGSYDSGYSYTTALNYIASGKPGISNSGGARALSLMVWDLLEGGKLKGKKELKSAAKRLHQRTGTAVREAKVSNPMIQWALANGDLLSHAVEFVTDTATLKELGASSKQNITVRYSCCSTESVTSCTRFTEKVKSHRKFGTPVKCADCSKSYIALSSYILSNRQILEDSRIGLDRLTEEQFDLPSGSLETVELFFGCHEAYVEITPASLKSKITRALRLNHTQITCNSCSVTQGKIEGLIVSFLRGNAATMDFLNLPSAQIEIQQELPGCEGMPFDALIITPDGMRVLIEVDGGFHYTNRDGVALAKKIESDRLKTIAAMEQGYSLIRIDERNLMGVTEEIQSLMLRATVGSVERYTVIGEECPGAAQVPTELKR